MWRFYIRPGFALVAVLLTACGAEPLAVTGSQGQKVVASVGQQLTITLQTVGPGEYESPPAVSSLAVRFLDVAFVGPFVPAGPTQRFRFKAEAPGRAVITFQHSGNNPVVSDTVEVR